MILESLLFDALQFLSHIHVCLALNAAEPLC